MRPLIRQSFCALALVLASVPAHGQAPPASVAQSTSSDRHEVTNEKDHHFIGKVEFQRGDTQIFADEAWFYGDTNHFIASGNVVFSQGTSRISADRADFDTQSNLGTFYGAYGAASVRPPQQAARPGAIAPPAVGNQETEVYFFGDTVEKVGPKKYRITNGGFTTCVQPTPRWDLHAGAVVLNIDNYTLLRNAVFNVKGVPVFYVPFLAYPTKKEERATGFLIPTYGSSTLRGQQIHNAFFWAINRSMDATIGHEWYSRAGSGVTGEYRYNFGGGSDGYLASNLRRDKEITLSDAGGSTLQQAGRTYELRGAMNQMLPGRMRARASVDYFSDLRQSLTYNNDINYSSRNTRSYGGNVIGAWGTYSLNGTFDQSEFFYGNGSSGTRGSAPRVNIARNERPLLGSDVYFAMTGEYVRILQANKGVGAEGNTVVDDNGLTRLDFFPQIRYPFKRWQWFTVNSTFSWRDTFYTRSQTPDTDAAASIRLEESLNRRYFTAQASMVGPVFNRIWDTPDNGYAEKFKHTIEPNLTISRTSAIENFDRIVKLESIDYTVGSVTQFNYGLTNRFFAKRRVAGRPSFAREFLNVSIAQSYYTDAKASQYDRQYATSFSGAPPSHFSPVVLTARAIPTDNVNGTMRAEFDSTHRSLRTISANGSYILPGVLQSSVGWSKKFLVPELSGYDNPAYLDHSLNQTTLLHTRDNKYGGMYSFSYDVLHAAFLQQRISGYYNAQCCGIAFEYMRNTYNTLTPDALGDHRFFLSFTLAGLGNFSPFSGAMNGVPR